MGSIEEQLIIANWFYYLGEPVLSDKVYNENFELLRGTNPHSPVITKTWSEFGEPTELLKKYNLYERSEEIKSRFESEGKIDLTFLPEENLRLRKQYYSQAKEHFEAYTLKSIDTVSSLAESDMWLNSLTGAIKPPFVMNISNKGDGFNIPNYYVNGYYIGSHTRGRSGNKDDVTIAMSKVLPWKIETDTQFLLVITEATCPFTNLEKARQISKKSEGLKTARSAVKSLLTANSGDEMHKLLLPLVINVIGLDFESKSHMFSWAEISGFTAIDNEDVEIHSSHDILNVIKRWSTQKAIYETDGIIVSIANKDLYNKLNTEGKYDEGIRAYRLYEWSASIYCSFFLGLEPSYNAHNISLQIKILPTQVASGATVESLTVNNPRRLIQSGLRLGLIVVFQYKHGSYPEFLDMYSLVLSETIGGFDKTPSELIPPLVELRHRLNSMDTPNHELSLTDNKEALKNIMEFNV